MNLRRLWMGKWLAAASMLAAGLQPHPGWAEMTALPRAVSFVATGGESGFGLSEVLSRLVKAKAVGMRPQQVAPGQAPIAAVRASYGLPEWVDISGLLATACEYNQGVCSIVRNQAVWRIQAAGRTALPSGACDSPRHAADPADFMCIPDVSMTMGRTFITRTISRDESAAIPVIVTGSTRGCTVFDPMCQRLVLARNSAQEAAWQAGQSAGVYAASPAQPAPASQPPPWWRALQGRVVLPAAMISVSLPPLPQPVMASAQCNALMQAVVDADRAIRAKRQLTAEFSFIIATDCATAVANRAAFAGRPRALMGAIAVSPEFRDSLTASIRTAMNLVPTDGSPGGHPLIGVWDGKVENRLSLLRRAGFGRLTNTNASLAGTYGLLEGTVVSWMDPFPQALFSDPPGGPCGSIEPSLEHVADHGTLIASMIAGDAEGLLPGARLWAHEWDRRRYELGKKAGPQNSLDWFNDNVLEARLLGRPPHIANLSCGVDYDQQTEADAWQSLTAHLSGLNNTETVAPFLVAVAAGNRAEASDPISVAAPQDPMKIPAGGSGYTFLARQYATSGFISVVGLSPSGDDVLQCRDIQQVLAQAKQSGAAIPDLKIAGFCQADAGGSAVSRRAPLVVSGTVFDVGAVGVGVGITQAQSGPVVMWGSSFAAPYVTGLAAQVVEKLTTLVPTGVAQANLVADRIRLTADRIGSPNIVRYGRVNGARALAFETDLFEFNPLPADPAEQTLDAQFAGQCSAEGGHIELNRDKSRTALLTLEGDIPLKLDEVLRIRAADDKYEVMYRARPYRFGPSLAIAMLKDDKVMLPVQCAGRANKPRQPTMMQLQVVQSFTRCSFGIDRCK